MNASSVDSQCSTRYAVSHTVLRRRIMNPSDQRRLQETHVNCRRLPPSSPHLNRAGVKICPIAFHTSPSRDFKCTVMSPPFLASIDLSEYASSTLSLTSRAIFLVGHAFASVSLSAYEDALIFLQKTNKHFPASLDVSALTSIDHVVSLLDAGAAKVFATRHQLDLLISMGIDQGRLALILTENLAEPMVDAIKKTSVALSSPQTHDMDFVEAWLGEHGTDRPDVYVSLRSPQTSDALRLAKSFAVPILPIECLTTDPINEPHAISVASLLLANATSDRPDGLIPTIVCDERGAALGLVYSNEDSISESLRTARGVYQSRKRGLWYKGESSGDVQELRGLSLDCDHDCLRFLVKQRGRGNGSLITENSYG